METLFCLLAFFLLAVDSGGGSEMVLNVTMPATESTVGVRNFNLSVGGLSSLEFQMRGCGGLMLSLLRPTAAAAGGHPFVQVYLGHDSSTYGLIIRECLPDRERCEDRALLKRKVIFCYDYISFWLRWNSSTIEAGGGFYDDYSRTLISYSPPFPSSPSPVPSPTMDSSEEDAAVGEAPVQVLSGIRRLRVENENTALLFTIYRGQKLNYCFVLETEEPRVTQCGDDFIDREQCLDCGCCYDDVRQPPCFQSFAAVAKESSANCTRSLEELFPEMHLFLAPQTIYLNDSVDHLVVIGSFLPPQFQFAIDFGDEQLIELTNFTLVEPLPEWLPETMEFQRLQPERNLSTAQLNEMFRRSVVHVYEKNKTFSVSLLVSGRLNRNESSWTSWNKSFTVTVHARPTMEQALNGTFLFSSYPVYRLAPASFFYLVRNSDPSINSTIAFADGSPTKNVSLDAMRVDRVPAWITNGSYSSADDDSQFIPDILEEISDFHGGEIHHVFQSSGLLLVNFTVSAHLKLVGVHSTVTRTSAVTVRPSMTDATGPMLFISMTPAYVGIPVHFLFLIRNHYPSLLYKINYGDGNSTPGTLEINFNGSHVPEWVRRKYYKLHGVNKTYAERVLSESGRYNCSLVSYVFDRVRRYTTKVTVSGELKAVGRYEYVTLVSIVDVIEQRKTIWELLATFVLLTSSVNYVNESTYFLYRFGDFSDDLELFVNYGDGTPTESLSVTGSATLPHWARSGQYVSPDDNETVIEQVFADHGDSFLGGVSSHEYALVGTYNVTFHVRGPLKDTHGEIQRQTTTTIRRRPALTEVVGEVLVLVKRPVYEGVNTTFLALVENHFPALSYDLDFGDDSSREELLVRQNLTLPVWVKSPKFSYHCAQGNRSVVDELFSRVPSISGALAKHIYTTPGPRNVSISVSGWLDIVARSDEHRSDVVVVDVKTRSRLSDSLGASVLLVSSPATVNENVRFLFIGSKFVPDVGYRLDFGDGSPAETMTPISTNLNALEWMSDQRFAAFGPVDTQLPEIMADLTRFNGTAATQTHVYTAESTYPIYLLLSAEYKVPLEMGRFILNVTRRSTVEPTDRDQSPVAPLSPATESHSNRAASSSSTTETSASATVSLPLSAPTPPRPPPYTPPSPPPSTNISDANVSTKGTPSRVRPSPAMSTPSSITTSAGAGGPQRCGPMEIIVTGGGLERQSPASFTRRDSFALKAYVLNECHRHLLSDVVWKVYRLSEMNDDDLVEIWMPTAFVSETEVHILRYTIDYGTYKIQAKIVQNGREFVGDAYVAITSSPLTVKILGDDVIQTDIETSVIIKAEPGTDVDEPRELGFGSMSFEWLCMNSGEKSPYSDPIHEDNEDGVGCYGNGRRMNSTSKEFRFDPDLLYYSDLPTFFTVQVALTKPNRPRALASQSVVVVYPENPLRIRCALNCGAYMNTWMDLVLNTTCGAPVCRETQNLVYRWDFLPLCPQNSVKQLTWMKDTMTSLNQSSLHLKSNVFNSSQGNEPYQFTLTVTVDNSRHFETRYQFLTRRNDPVRGGNLHKDASKVDDPSTDRGNMKTGEFCLIFLSQIFLLNHLQTA